MIWDRMLQEVLLEQPHGQWRMLVGCILLNVTTRRQAEPVWPELFRRWPTPEALAAADRDELGELLRPLGCWRRRAASLSTFSSEWCNLEGVPEEVESLPGIGKYAGDSWRIFVLGHQDVEPTDKELRRYLALRSEARE